MTSFPPHARFKGNFHDEFAFDRKYTANGFSMQPLVGISAPSASSGREPVSFPTPALSAKDVLGPAIQMNGNQPALAADDVIPQFPGELTHSGHLTFAPATITFSNSPKASNNVCP
jgi:hypothetical protein